MSKDYGVCECCGYECNPASQQCGGCMRHNTINSFHETNLSYTLRVAKIEISRYTEKVSDVELVKVFVRKKLENIPGTLLSRLEEAKDIDELKRMISDLPPTR